MYFWKIENLKEDIRTKQFTEKDRFIYMFVTLIFTSFMIEIMVLLPSESLNIWSLIDSLLYILIVSLGTLLAFKANGGAMGVDFLGKYFSILFVVGIRFIPLFILVIISLIAYYYFSSLEIKEIEQSNFLEILLPYSWQIAMYWRIIKHMKDVKEIQ